MNRVSAPVQRQKMQSRRWPESQRGSALKTIRRWAVFAFLRTILTSSLTTGRPVGAAPPVESSSPSAVNWPMSCLLI